MSSNNNAKFAFWYLLSLVALIFMALSTGQVIFQVINKYIPEFVSHYGPVFDTSILKFAISSLIISTPLYFITVRQIEQSLEEKELPKDAAVRRWLTYFILLISSLVVIIWLIMTINSFLDGELTSKFLLKTLTVVVISGLVFSYYLYDIRRSEVKKKNPIILAYLITGLILTIGSLVTAFWIGETPAEARARRHDIEVLGHFDQISATIQNYYAEQEKLPSNLDELKDQTPYLNAAALKDPKTGESYAYNKINDTQYELCATFEANNIQTNNTYDYAYADRWPHEKGYHCLKQKVVNDPNAMPLKAAPMMSR